MVYLLLISAFLLVAPLAAVIAARCVMLVQAFEDGRFQPDARPTADGGRIMTDRPRERRRHQGPQRASVPSQRHRPAHSLR